MKAVRVSMKFAVTALVIVVAGGLLAPMNVLAAPQMTGSKLSGSILGGFGFWPPESCDALPDCAAWRSSRCNPALVGIDPAWLTSIVDVSTWADGTTPRAFEIHAGAGGNVAGGAVIQFWQSDCREITGNRLHTVDGTTFKVPPASKWMTVAANDNLRVEWTMESASQTPVRSGSILAGIYSTGPWACSATPDCALWLQSDCDLSALASQDPGLFTSIVDVEDLARSGGKWRLAADLKVMPPYGGALILEFWGADCERIQPLGQNLPYVVGSVINDAVFQFPPGARWMTLVSSDLVLVDWELWRSRRS